MTEIDFQLDTLRPSDVRSAARLHRLAFPSFFLSSLGEPFLIQFYRGFTRDGTAVTVAARDHAGRLRGVVVGTCDPAGFFARLMRRQWVGWATASARAVLARPLSVGRLLRAVSYRGATQGDPGGALLSSVCIDPHFQGCGLGRRLVERWLVVAATSGVKQAFLATDAMGNDEVNRFYQGLGWHLDSAYRTREGRQMNLYTIALQAKT